jgi:hypothetical protein
VRLELNATRQRRSEKIERFRDHRLDVDRRALPETAAAECEDLFDQGFRPAGNIAIAE